MSEVRLLESPHCQFTFSAFTIEEGNEKIVGESETDLSCRMVIASRAGGGQVDRLEDGTSCWAA